MKFLIIAELNQQQFYIIRFKKSLQEFFNPVISFKQKSFKICLKILETDL